MTPRQPLLALATMLISAAGLALAGLFAAVGIASAEITGPCGATLNGVDAKSVDSGNRGDDIKVSKDASVPVVFTTTSGFASHKFQLEFGGIPWTVSEKSDNGSNQFVEQANVAGYARYGVGLYKVVGVATLTDGSTCSGAATVDVAGNPLNTVAGVAGAGAVAVGTAAGLASGLASARSGQPHWAEDLARDRRRLERILGCASVLPMAVLLTLLMLPGMAISGGGGGGPVPRAPLRRLPWRPRITLLGLVSGLLAGAGGVVLLQQYSVAYPTRGLIVTTLLLGAVVYGVVLPTLGRMVARARVNRRLAAQGQSS